jgi:hypothetical protein
LTLFFLVEAIHPSNQSAISDDPEAYVVRASALKEVVVDSTEGTADSMKMLEPKGKMMSPKGKTSEMPPPLGSPPPRGDLVTTKATPGSSKEHVNHLNFSVSCRVHASAPDGSSLHGYAQLLVVGHRLRSRTTQLTDVVRLSSAFYPVSVGAW